MKNELQLFTNSEFGELGLLIIDGMEYFPATACAKILGYTNPQKAIRDHCKGCTKRSVGVTTGKKSDGSEAFQEVEMNFISEGDLFRLIVKSKLPNAEKFERWVFDEVLPSIRKHGGYMINQENMTPEQLIANALVFANNIINDQKNQIETMKPKAEFHDAVVGSSDTIDMGQVAKVLNMGVGRNTLFEILREEKVLRQNNEPYQAYIDKNWFRLVESKYQKPNGDTCINIKTVVFQKGVDGIRKILENRKI